MTARLGTVARFAQGWAVDAVRSGLAARADPTKAVQMQAYMKSPLPYQGVPTPVLRAICREAFARSTAAVF